MDINIANPTQSREIAKLIMTAMNYECCQYFTGNNHTLAEFEDMMTYLVSRTDSQYSYLNTLVSTTGNSVAGICVSYNGAQLRNLRRAFISETLQRFGNDFSNIDDETQAGELYIDSLCVKPEYRGRGIASSLIRATIEKARSMEIPAVGLLVDQGNPKAEALYSRLGFAYKNDASWGGHPMKHLQYSLG